MNHFNKTYKRQEEKREEPKSKIGNERKLGPVENLNVLKRLEFSRSLHP